MVKKYLFLALAALVTVSCHKLPDNPITTSNIVPPPLPKCSQRIKKVIQHVKYPGTGFNDDVYPTEYFYDAQGRVDSIDSRAKQKILYAANGQVKLRLQYDYYNPKVLCKHIYHYNSVGRVGSILSQYFDENNQQGQQFQTFFEYDNFGFVVKEWQSNGDDEMVPTREGGNAIKVQRFYNATGQEHFLSIAAFDENCNPEYLAGLNNIYPGSYNPNNTIFEQILYWDCGDYDGSPQNYTITYNDEGLPLKSEENLGNHWIEYIYE